MGDPSSAMEWFDQVEAFDELESWTDLTLYSRARSLEAVVKYPEAIRLYQASRSPQQAGDAIRARILQALDDARNSAETEASEEESSVESPPMESDEDR